jgi:hypothetical protein
MKVNCFLVLGLLHGVQGEFTDGVLETAVDPIFTGHDLEGKGVGRCLI